jgi:hypothetical protein
MTTGTLGAIVLGNALAKQAEKQGHPRTEALDLTGLAERFQKKLAHSNEVPWLVSTGEDFRCPITEGGKPDLRTRLALRYLSRVLARATVDARVSDGVLQVLHLLRPPASLLTPSFLARVILPARSGTRAAEPSGQEALR